jgi:putative ABC transport system permease protein
VLLLALGGLSLILTRSLVAGFGGILAIGVGIALLSPAATAAGMRFSARPLAALMGSLGRRAARTVVNALSRTRVAIAALMVALSVTIGVSLMMSSFRATVVNWLDLTPKADIYTSEPAAGGARPAASLDPGLEVKLAQLPGVEQVETFRAAEVESGYGPVALTVVDSRRTRDAKLYRLASGTAEAVWRAVRAGAVIVSEPFAYRHALPARGAHVTLTTDRGPHDFPAAAVYYDDASDRGTILVAREVYNEYWDDRAISSLGVFVSVGPAAGEAVTTIRAALQGTGLEVRDNAAVRREALRIFDRTFAITAALRVLAVVVAFIGVLSALLAPQIERRRELATMQALGLGPRGLWALTLTETGLMGLTAGWLAWPTGTLLAAVLIYITGLRAFGWTIRMVAEPQVYLEALGVGVAAALLAAVDPAIVLNRSPVAEPLRLEWPRDHEARSVEGFDGAWRPARIAQPLCRVGVGRVRAGRARLVDWAAASCSAAGRGRFPT